jgi:hypothetical protein
MLYGLEDYAVKSRTPTQSIAYIVPTHTGEVIQRLERQIVLLCIITKLAVSINTCTPRVGSYALNTATAHI